jgi:hypothetical protein
LTLIQGRNRCIETKIKHLKNVKINCDFRFNTPIPSLNQGQRSVFTVRECAQSIPRLEKLKNRRFSHKNLKMFDFRFNTLTPFPESGSRKHFHASRVRAIDFSHKIIPRTANQKNFL